MKTAIRAFALLAAAAIFGPAYGQQHMGKACKGDAARLCPGMKPGSDDMIACIKAHREDLSPACKEAAAKMRTKVEQKQQEQAPPPSEMPNK